MKFFKSKRAEDAGDISTIPQEVFIEVVLVAMLVLLATAFIAFIYTDARVYHLFHSKDMSLLQDAMLLTTGDVSFLYENNDGKDAQGKMNILDYEFSPYYTTTISSTSRGYKKSQITKSYIHFANHKTEISPTVYFSNPEQLLFVKTENEFNVYEDVRSYDKNSDNGCESGAEVKFNPNEPFYINHNTNFDLTTFLTLLNKPYLDANPPVGVRYFTFITYPDFNGFIKEYLASEQENKNYGVYVGISYIEESRINIYVPFETQGNLGCAFYNSIITELDDEQTSVNYIPTNSASVFSKLSKFDYYFEIETSKDDLRDVLDALEKVLKTEP